MISGAVDDLILKNLSIAYIDLSRETLAYEVLSMGADAIFWLDHDMTFPHTAIARLLAHNVPIIGCGYRRRQAPTFPRMPVFKEKQKMRFHALSAEYMLGGFTLVRKEVYEKMERPWYRCGWGLDPENPQAHIGEDISFSERATKAGYDLLVDMELTKEIGHLAEVELKWDMGS